jgi:hypothetical protein
MSNHLKENNETYFSHLKFACGIGLFLTFRGIIFLLHGLLPIVDVPAKFNIDSTTKKLSEWNEYTQERRKR